MTRKLFLSNLLKLRRTIPMILLAFAADFVHCVDAFKSDVKKTPGSFSSWTALNSILPSLSFMKYIVFSLWPTCMTLHLEELNFNIHFCDQLAKLSKSFCNDSLSDSVTSQVELCSPMHTWLIETIALITEPCTFGDRVWSLFSLCFMFTTNLFCSCLYTWLDFCPERIYLHDC